MNEAILREKANRRGDPRHVFYEAILSSNTYEDYYRNASHLKVEPETCRTSPVTAHMEIRYVRNSRGWIADREQKA